MTDLYAEVHVGITGIDPLMYPARDLLETLPEASTTATGLILFVDGDGFTAWSEPFPDDEPTEPVHVVVRIPQLTLEDRTLRYQQPLRETYAHQAREAVEALVHSHCPNPRAYRLVDYVAVDLSPVWGEDSAIVGRWA